VIRTVRIFLSSPGDVAADRAKARELLLGLARGPFVRGRVHIDVVSWDDPLAPAPMDFRFTPQQAVDRSLPTPADCDLTVVLLDRPRHADLVAEIRAAGARIKLITDGDVAGAVMAAMPETGIDLLVGIGGAPEGVVSVCALKSIGGNMQCRIWPRNDTEWQIVRNEGIDVTRVLGMNDLIQSDNVFFAATGITDGELLQGVHYLAGGVTTESLVMRSTSGTVRRVKASHRLDKLSRYSAVSFD
jgi:fructose-1,6-bisphosphatase/sedoheptulose 1,7-bisphosphatase-like protein